VWCLLGVVEELFGVQRMSEGRKFVTHLIYTDLGSMTRCGVCKVSCVTEQVWYVQSVLCN
jgi:hypothetical protein